ncbi:MAG: glycosyltransferase family 4 protein [Patescibacteria group bacterium]
MRVTLYRDYKEEGWESMEVYADNLHRSLTMRRKDLSVGEFTALPALSRIFAANNKFLRYFFRFVINPFFAKWHQGDVNHIIDQANAHLLYRLDPRKTVVTCHDLIVPYWVMHNVPQTYKKRIKRLGELWRIRFLKKAAKIIAVSQATKDDIVHTLGIDPGKIVVIHEGVDDFFKKRPDERDLRKAKIDLMLPRRYILHVGTTHEYKNMETLISLFASLRKKDKNLFLVKVGAPWTADQQVLIERLGLGNFIRHLGFITKRELPAVYRMAVALVHPSRTEGFGFTVLEAMASGCPVIVSDIPALRELVDTAGIYIHPLLTKKDIQRVASLLNSPPLLRTYRLRGHKRAVRYSWQNCARQTYGLYQEIVKRNIHQR